MGGSAVTLRMQQAEPGPLTVAMLAARGRLDHAVAACGRGEDGAQARRDRLLARVSSDRDPLCAAVAMTEQALLDRLHDPRMPPRAIPWPCDPAPVLAALSAGQAPPDAAEEVFVLTVQAGGLGWRPMAWAAS